MPRDDEPDAVTRRLDIIIQLLAFGSPGSQPRPIADIIGSLDQLGLSAIEISRIVNRKSNYVGAVLGQIKKKKPKDKPSIVRRGKKQ